jgi:hypothetical protein
VDVSRAADQLQIPAALVPEFEDFVVPGSGRVVEFTPLTATGKAAP